MHSSSSSQTHDLELGFAALNCCSEMGDYIGMESCFDIQHNEDLVSTEKNRRAADNSRRRGSGKHDRRCEMKKEKEYPPPIPLLARTENLPSHMPWVMKRYYTGDGRLIIKEEKVKHHEYFRAHRANGRLTLQIVPLDDDVLLHHPPADYQNDYLSDDEEETVEDGEPHHDDNDDDDDESVDDWDRTVVDLSSKSTESGTVLMGGAGGKCYKYNSTVGSSSWNVFVVE
ncbi:hypothetical protein F0562_027388 [Nyssa sinensis]|uniref:FAF domain-containing protein n=1 Tax=Nyssa sinensis TaxID=561372 RepID=A0A5J5B823_9ASTE|nr:hypothetical protein F0562_027388 [Nyssa sinensis]